MNNKSLGYVSTIQNTETDLLYIDNDIFINSQLFDKYYIRQPQYYENRLGTFYKNNKVHQIVLPHEKYISISYTQKKSVFITNSDSSAIYLTNSYYYENSINKSGFIEWEIV